MKNSTLGLLLNLGESFTSLGGQAELMLNQNILPYSKAFSHVYVFTYGQEVFSLPPNCQLITPPFKLHRYVYALLLPIIYGRIIRQCNLLRCFQLAGTLPAIISKLLYGTKFVFNYGYDYAAFARIEAKPLQSLGFKLLEKLVFRLANGVIFKSRDLLPATRHQLRAKSIYLPNGVDVKMFKPKPKRFSRVPTVLYVGRLEPQKNLPVLLTALSQVNRAVKIIFVGRGSQKQQLISQAHQLKLDLTIQDKIDHDQLPPVYHQADIFVLPSLIEGSPKVLLEAMASGLPIVASNVVGIKEITQDKLTGILVAPTVSSLTSGINRILTHPQLACRLGVSARREAVRHYNQDTLIKAEINFLKSCA